MCDKRPCTQLRTKLVCVYTQYAIKLVVYLIVRLTVDRTSLNSGPFRGRIFLVFLCLFILIPALKAQEKPYFVTYSHDLEEPGNLEIETKSTLGQPAGSNNFGALTTELEYGVTGWWTSEFYLDGQATAQESAILTGFRFENRFRPLMREH